MTKMERKYTTFLATLSRISLFQHFFNLWPHDVNTFLFEAKENIGLMHGW